MFLLLYYLNYSVLNTHTHVSVVIVNYNLKTREKERATPTQLIKITKTRHLVGVTIFRSSMWPRPPQILNTHIHVSVVLVNYNYNYNYNPF